MSSFSFSGGILGPYTWGTKPATIPAGAIAYISDVGPNGSHWCYLGGRWRAVNGRVFLGALDTVSANVNGTDTMVFTRALPATLLQLKDRLELRLTPIKSGTTDAMNVIPRLGTTGTTADQALNAGTTFLATTNRHSGTIIDFRVESATTVQEMGVSSLTTAGQGYAGSVNAAQGAAVTISNVSNALTFGISISSGATNACNLSDAQLWLDTSPN